MVKEKQQTSAPVLPMDPIGDVQYSVQTDNKFDGVAEASDDPFDMLDKLTLTVKTPKEKTEKSASKDKKKPASAPPKTAKPEAANDKPAKKDEKPANANAQKAPESGKDVKPGATDSRAPRGRGGRGGGHFAGGAVVTDEQLPPASAPVQREPPPPPKYDQPRPEGAGAPRGRGRGFGGFGGFGGGFGAPRGRGGPRGPRPAFGESVPSETNAAPGAPSGGGGEDAFVNRGFDTGERRMGGGFRGRGGFRGGRGRGRGFQQRVPGDFGTPDVPGGPTPARKREFDRHSGSDITGVRPVDKREGGGAHNWGTVQDDLAGQTANLNETLENVEEGAPTAAPTGQQTALAEGAEAPKEGEGDKSAEDAKAEDDKKEFTLEEYKAQLQQKLAPKTNFNVRPPEGADLKGLKQVVKKKEDQTEYVEEDGAEVIDADANKKGVKVAKQPKAAPVKDVGFRYENPQGDFGPRRGRGGRGFRGAGVGAPAGVGAGAGEGGGFRGRGRGRFGGEGGAAPPRLEDEDAFPALNPLGPH